MKSKTLINIVLFAGVVLTTGTFASAQSKDELRRRAEQRYPALRQLKSEGIVGETSDGFVAVVEGKTASADAQKLVDAENADRRVLYAIIAKEGNTTPEQVATSAAARNFDRAQSGEWLRTNGKWSQKK